MLKAFNKLKDLVFLMRPHVWFVTIFSLSVGAVFAIYPSPITIETLSSFLFLCIAFACFIASGLYVLNDVNDRKLDKKNPDKASRPIAAGKVSAFQGIIFSFILLSIGCFLALQISLLHLILALILIGFQLIYSMPPIRLKETSLDFLFSGPLNHMVRFVAAWTLFQPLIQVPIILLISLFLLYNAAYVYYKLIDKKFIPKKSIARRKITPTLLNFVSVLGVALMFASILLHEVHFTFIACPIFLSLSLLVQAIIPNSKKIGLIRTITYGYAPAGLALGAIGLWALIILF